MRSSPSCSGGTERLVALGYELREAAVLAFSHLDVHESSLIAQGLPARDRRPDRRLTEE